MSVSNVLVVDDHPLFCDALSMTLVQAGIADDVRTCHDLGSALDILQTLRPGAILLDLNLPDVEGATGISRLKAQVPDVPVLVVSSVNDNHIISTVMRSGASGFVRKDSPREEIINAFRIVWRGHTYTPPGYVKQLSAANNNTQALTDRLNSLTPAQRRILHSMGEGKLNKQIAADMEIAESTVKAHITAIFRKLGVYNRTQAVLMALEANFGLDA